MDSAVRPTRFGPNNVQPYRMHVSQKYWEQTKKKLEFVRLPKDPQGIPPQRPEFGVNKAEFETILDYWTDEYDWRAQEAFYNEALPQFRAFLSGTHLHFVHKTSDSPNAIPLLFVHGWPESFISVARIIKDLWDPVATPGRSRDSMVSFHVVAASNPGFGFSDPVHESSNNMQTTAGLLDGLMKGLGYTRYIAHGSGWAFKICRILALAHPGSCVGIHTVNPDVPAPSSGYGFIPEDVQLGAMSLRTPGLTPGLTPPRTPGVYTEPTERPQTTAYALADSPSGLLAYILEAIRPPSLTSNERRLSVEPSSVIAASPASSRPPTAASPSTVSTPGSGRSPAPPAPQSRSPQTFSIASPWTTRDIVDWTMVYWFPGPEVPLRWLVNSSSVASTLWASHSPVPLGITHFQERTMGGTGTGTGQTPPEWAEAYQRIAVLRRREGRVRFPAWERPAEVVMDIREFAGIVFAGPPVGPQGMPMVVPSQMGGWPQQ